MITDNETNYLYLAESLKKKKKYLEFSIRFERILKECNIEVAYLKNTRDIWAVDYMPIQIGINKFVQFDYNPDYLQSESGLKSKSDSWAICKEIGIIPLKSDIIVDGGNVVRGKNQVIICDKVFKENPSIKEKVLIKKLKDTLEVDKIVFVPWDKKNDFIGHADGMVRFYNESTVFINKDLSERNVLYNTNLKMALYNANLDWIEISYNPHNNTSNSMANGIYLNFLEMKNVVIVPTFGLKEDEEALKIFENYFKQKIVKTIDCNDIANDGGVLNCITWNIHQRKSNPQRVEDSNLIPLYKYGNTVLIGLADDYKLSVVEDGLVVKLNINEKNIESKPFSGQKLLKHSGYFNAVEKSEQGELLGKIWNLVGSEIIAEIEDMLLNPDQESICSLIWIPERLK